jgi:hypothetical protein
MSNPLRGPDAPYDPLANRVPFETNDVRKPSRFEPTQSTVRQSQMDAVLASRVARVGAVSLANATTISWDTKIFDDKGIWSGGTQFIIPSTGKITGPWLFHAKITWPGTGAGSNRQIDILQAGVSIATMQGPASTTGQEISTLVYSPKAGALYTVQVTQDSGGPLAMTVGATNMFFEVHHPY